MNITIGNTRNAAARQFGTHFVAIVASAALVLGAIAWVPGTSNDEAGPAVQPVQPVRVTAYTSQQQAPLQVVLVADAAEQAWLETQLAVDQHLVIATGGEMTDIPLVLIKGSELAQNAASASSDVSGSGRQVVVTDGTLRGVR